MARWLVLGLLFTAALAGCIQEDTMQDPDDVPVGEDGTTGASDGLDTNSSLDDGAAPEDEALAPADFDLYECDGVALFAIDDYGNIDDFLPAGFFPADIVSLLKLEGYANLGQGAMGPVVVDCDSNSLTGKPVSVVLPGTMVDTPIIEGINASWVDGYEDFIAVSDPAVADLFTTFGWDVEVGIELDLIVDVDEGINELVGESQVPGAATARVTGTLNETVVFTGYVASSTTYHTYDPEGTPIRFWHDTPDGISYLKSHIDEHGRSGASWCTFEGRFAETFGRTECGPDSVGIVITDFGLQTTLIRLDGVHA